MNPRERRPRSRIPAFGRRLAPWGFPICYLGWAYLWWLPIVLSGDSVWTFPNVAFLLVGGSSPLVAGLSLLWLTSGRDGYRDLRRRLTETDRIRRRWWLVIALLYPTFTLVAAAVAIAIGYTSSPLEIAEPRRLLEPGSLALLLAVALVFPVVEEIGLRGYWFDQLQARWSALAASLILGVVWAAWHVPLVYMVGYYDETTFQPELWWWLPSIVLTAIVGTWVYNNTRRSVLAVIGLHFVGNLTGETMGFASEMYPVVHLGTVLVAVCLVIVWGPKSLRGWGVPKPTAGVLERSN
ncbi:CPBP family intramembrane glutamic endopeptidase [Natronococcus amylolyticus]|uniref:CPBP family intramembrane glutamic endopeptidase n=1 Tax=Natronococcus amylolyticus TaxID=44470 RepID=UPI001F4D1529|nr:type II CAAX endopeptidase family protein [Natronococcus amylolyticus]